MFIQNNESENTKGVNEINNPSDENSGYFLINNNLGYDITALYAGDYFGEDNDSVLAEIGTLTNNNHTDEFTPPFDADFNIWYEYIDESTGENLSMRLTSGIYGLLYNFNLSEDQRYYLDLYKKQDSNNVTFRFSLIGDQGLPVVEDPAISISSNIIDITCETKEAVIIYTLDGSIPTMENGSVYTSNFIQYEDVTVKTFAYLEGYQSSSIITEQHTFTYLSYLPEPYVLRSYNEISLYPSMISDATIVYTLDGTTPTREHGTIYTEPFTITEDVTLKAFEYLDIENSVYGDSPVLTEELQFYE